MVGPTGAGKTTLVNLVMRFYELDGGQITSMVSTSRRCLGSTAWTDRHGAARYLAVRGRSGDNIAYGDPNATDEQIGGCPSDLR
ncbi:MAG: ATP-binding cassette domain-containing protein [Marmoricola sp.]